MYLTGTRLIREGVRDSIGVGRVNEDMKKIPGRCIGCGVYERYGKGKWPIQGLRGPLAVAGTE